MHISAWDVPESSLCATEKGVVECAIVGESPRVLCFHARGSGGYDQSIICFDLLVEAGFSGIYPSRPGYPRTPLST